MKHKVPSSNELAPKYVSELFYRHSNLSFFIKNESFKKNTPQPDVLLYVAKL